MLDVIGVGPHDPECDLDAALAYVHALLGWYVGAEADPGVVDRLLEEREGLGRRIVVGLPMALQHAERPRDAQRALAAVQFLVGDTDAQAITAWMWLEVGDDDRAIRHAQLVRDHCDVTDVEPVLSMVRLYHLLGRDDDSERAAREMVELVEERRGALEARVAAARFVELLVACEQEDAASRLASEFGVVRSR